MSKISKIKLLPVLISALCINENVFADFDSDMASCRNSDDKATCFKNVIDSLNREIAGISIIVNDKKFDDDGYNSRGYDQGGCDLDFNCRSFEQEIVALRAQKEAVVTDAKSSGIQLENGSVWDELITENMLPPPGELLPKGFGSSLWSSIKGFGGSIARSAKNVVSGPNSLLPVPGEILPSGAGKSVASTIGSGAVKLGGAISDGAKAFGSAVGASVNKAINNPNGLLPVPGEILPDDFGKSGVNSTMCDAVKDETVSVFGSMGNWSRNSVYNLQQYISNNGFKNILERAVTAPAAYLLKKYPVAAPRVAASILGGAAITSTALDIKDMMGAKPQDEDLEQVGDGNVGDQQQQVGDGNGGNQQQQVLPDEVRKAFENKRGVNPSLTRKELAKALGIKQIKKATKKEAWKKVDDFAKEHHFIKHGGGAQKVTFTLPK